MATMIDLLRYGPPALGIAALLIGALILWLPTKPAGHGHDDTGGDA